jgi:hypothetical protein
VHRDEGGRKQSAGNRIISYAGNCLASTQEQLSENWKAAGLVASPALKRMIRVETLFRSAEALLPPHECGGSHPVAS